MGIDSRDYWGSATVSSRVDLNQPQGNQFRSDDSQQESRNHPAVGAVPVPTPTRMEIVLCLVPYKRSNGQVSLQPCWWKRVSAVGFLFVVELRPDPALWEPLTNIY